MKSFPLKFFEQLVEFEGRNLIEGMKMFCRPSIKLRVEIIEEFNKTYNVKRFWC